VLKKWAGPNKWAGWADFFAHYMKNSGEGGQIFRFLHENQPGAGWINFQKSINGKSMPIY
jgi:hypothetical protein